MSSGANHKAQITLLLRVAAVLIFIPMWAAAASQALYDDFDDNMLDPALWTASLDGVALTIAETNQRLEIAHPAESADSANGIFIAGYVSVCQLRGDFDIQVDYRLLTWPSANGVRVGLATGLGTVVERVSLGNPLEFPGEPREIYVADFGGVIHGITETSYTEGKLRQVRSGSTVTGYYFLAGEWAPVHSGEATTDDTSFVIASWSHDSVFTDQTVKVAFDNVIVNEGELICPPIEVSIDVKPGSFPNSVQPRSRGRMPVAILTTDSFDAHSVDPSAVLFGRTGTEASPAHSALEDVDGDGDTDMILHFKTQETGIQCGDTIAYLTGATATGRAIVGDDAITTVGCH